MAGGKFVYEVNIPGKGAFTVESAHELTDQQAYSYAASQQGGEGRSAGQEFVRGAGLAARGAAPVAAGAGAGFMVGGVPGALAGSLTLPAAEIAAQGINLVLPNSMQIPSPTGAVENLLTRLGFPVAETTGERVIQAGGSALGGTATQLATLPTIAKTATTDLGRSLAQTMAQQPGRQLAASVPSAAASQVVAESTGSPLLGQLAGMGTGAAFSVGARTSPKVDPSELNIKATQAFKAARDSGILMDSNAFNGEMTKIAKQLRAEGYTPTGFPKIAGVIQELTGNNMPKDFTELQALRKLAKTVQQSTDPSEQRLATILVDRIDNYILNAPDNHLLTGGTKDGLKAWAEARNLYSRQMKAEIFDEMLQNAELDKSKFTASGAENSLATQLRQLAKNDRKMRLFTPTEQEAIRAAAKGTNTQNLLKFFGRFAPTGTVSSIFSGGAIAYEPTIGAPVALGAIGSRAGATQMRKNSVENLANIMRLGSPERAPAVSPAAILGVRGLLAPNAPLDVTPADLERINRN